MNVNTATERLIEQIDAQIEKALRDVDSYGASRTLTDLVFNRGSLVQQILKGYPEEPKARKAKS